MTCYSFTKHRDKETQKIQLHWKYNSLSVNGKG